MTELEPVTLQEAQFLVERPLDEINKAIERGEVTSRIALVTEPAKVKQKRVRRSAHRRRARKTRSLGYAPPKMVTKKVRMLDPEGLVYLALGRDVQENLTPTARRHLFNAIVISPTTNKIDIGFMQVPLKDARAKLIKRYRALRDIRTGIDEPKGAEPVFKGTDLKVYQIAALAEGQGIEETLEDYPGLKRRQVLRALHYARAYPKKGRPYPGRSLKRALATLASEGVFAVDEAATALGPDEFR